MRVILNLDRSPFFARRPRQFGQPTLDGWMDGVIAARKLENQLFASLKFDGAAEIEAHKQTPPPN